MHPAASGMHPDASRMRQDAAGMRLGCGGSSGYSAEAVEILRNCFVEVQKFKSLRSSEGISKSMITRKKKKKKKKINKKDVNYLCIEERRLRGRS